MDGLLVALILGILAFPAAAWAQRWMVSPEGDGAFHVLGILAFQELFLEGEGAGAILQGILGNLLYCDGDHTQHQSQLSL